MLPGSPARCGVMLLLLGAAAVAVAEEETAGSEVVYELAPYYSSIGLYTPLTDTPIRHLGETGELDIYHTLLVDAFVPRFLLVEASVYPMPLAGVYLKKHHPTSYDDAEFNNGVNLLESVTAGFEEPYAVALFFGNVVDFTAPEASRGEINKGHVGYLFSAGDYHIKANELIEDDWFEVEYKLKSDRHYRNHHLSMSYRIGAKLHSNDDITDVVYLGLRRHHLDHNAPPRWFPLWENSNISYRISADTVNYAVVDQELTMGKKWPLKGWGAALALDVGFIWYNARKYGGALADERGDNLTFILRPNLEF